MHELMETQHSAFQRDGFTLVKGILNAQELESLRLVINERAELGGMAIDGTSFWNPHGRMSSSARPPGRKCYLETGLWEQSGEIRHVAFDTSIPAMIAQLLGAKRIHFLDDVLIALAAGTKFKSQAVRDLQKMPVDASGRSAIVLLPADYHAGTALAGFIPGSHLTSPGAERSLASCAGGPVGSDRSEISYRFAEPARDEPKWITVETGDALIYDPRILRLPDPQIGEGGRRLLALCYCDEKCRIVRQADRSRASYSAASLTELNELGSSRFPVVFPKPWPDFPLATAYEQFAGPVSAHSIRL